jgi:hypothetical protein
MAHPALNAQAFSEPYKDRILRSYLEAVRFSSH